MRLLNTQTLKLEEFHQDVPKYAILSHRWGKEEVTFQDVSNDRAMTNKGWPKVVVCCRMAASRNMSYVWIDTCCIDKSSSAELTEAINTMYAWYEQATECYAYLSDVHGSLRASSPTDLAKEMGESVWFTRGWTLQELIAPMKVIFFNSRWERLWTKSTHSMELQFITNISHRLLEGVASLSDYSLAQRMAWAANRTTTRLEDEAYCLLGIFQVNMAMLYGEGKNAFRRLQEEIIKQSDDQTLFAWHDDRDIKPVLAPSVSCFRNLHDLKCIYATNDSRFGHTLSNSGLNIKLMLIPWAMDIYVAPLSCGRALVKPQSPSGPPTRGYSRMAIFLRRTKFEDHLVRVSIDGKDFVMLDSDVVAYKRDSFTIKDRQVFVRQSLVDLSDEVYHSFAFNYNRPQMFSNGQLPIPGVDILNSFDRQTFPYTRHYLYEPYGHYESAAFDIRNSSVDRHPHYLHLGFDVDFAPVCLVTTEPYEDDRVCKHDFEGMYSLRSKQVSSLPWLLSQIKNGKTSTSILAFKATRGASTEVRCKQLSLKIKFEVRLTSYEIDGLGRPAKMWHVTFEHFESIPTAPPTPNIPQTPPQLPTQDTSSDGRSTPRARKGSPWLKLLAFKRVKSPKSTFNVNEWLQDSEPEHRFVSSHMTQVPDISYESRMTTLPHSSRSPAYTEYARSPPVVTPFASVMTPSPPTTTPYAPVTTQGSTTMTRVVPLITPAPSSDNPIPIPDSRPPKPAPTLFQMLPVNVPPGPGSNLITAGWYQMGSDKLRQAMADNKPAAEYVQVPKPGRIYEMDGNDSSFSELSHGLSTIEETEPGLTQSDTSQTTDSPKDGSKWTAQENNGSPVVHRFPSLGRLRVVNV